MSEKEIMQRIPRDFLKISNLFININMVYMFKF